MIADAFGAPRPDPVVGEQFFVLIDARREDIDEVLHALLPAARMRQRQAADAEIAGHHALPREHLEDAQNLFALAEAVEEDAHRADVDGVRAQPHQMAVQAREFRQHHARPLRERRNFEAQQLFRRQAVHQVVRKRRQVVDAVRQRHALLIGLDLEFLFDAGMQIADIRSGFEDRFAVEFQQQTQHAMGRRVLRPHVEHHGARPAGLAFAPCVILLDFEFGRDSGRQSACTARHLAMPFR